MIKLVLLHSHFVDLNAIACLKWILQNDVESFLACLYYFGGMDLIMLNNTLLVAIVTVCRHVLLCWGAWYRDYISRNPKEDLLNCRCDLFEVSRITCYAYKFPNNCVPLQYLVVCCTSYRKSSLHCDLWSLA